MGFSLKLFDAGQPVATPAVWKGTENTLKIGRSEAIVVAVPLGVVGGLGLGILAWRNPWFERALRPVLDLNAPDDVAAWLVDNASRFHYSRPDET